MSRISKKKWDTYFAQIIKIRLKEHTVEVKPKVGHLPLEADIMVIKRKDKANTDSHPIWKHLDQMNLIEFKSLNDRIDPYTLDILLVYGMLYKRVKKISPAQKIKHWLIVPELKQENKEALVYKKSILNGLSEYQYKTEQIMILEYDKLDLKQEYVDLKIFGKKDIFSTVEMFFTQESQDNELEHEIANMLTNLRDIEVMEVIEMSPKLKRYTRQDILERAIQLYGGEDKLDDIIKLFGEDELINSIDKNKFINNIGKDELIKIIGKDELIKYFESQGLKVIDPNQP